MDLVSEPLEHRRGKAPNSIIVFDQEDRFSAAARARAIGYPNFSFCGGDAWQVDLERRAVFRLGVNFDSTAVLLDGAIDHRQSQSGSLARSLGREERLE